MARLKHSQMWFWSIRLALFDLIALIVCGVISMEVRGYTVLSGNFTLFDAFLVVATCMTCLAIVGGYETNRDMSTLRYASEHVLTMGVVLLVAFIETYAFSSFNYLVKPGRSVLFLGLILFAFLSLVYRYLLSRKAGRDATERFIYIVGTPELVSNLEEICRQAHFRHPLRFLNLSDSREFSNGMQENRLRNEDHPLMKAPSEQMGQCEGVVIDLFNDKLKPELEELLLRISLHTVPVYPVESFIETYFHMIYLPHVTLSWALDGTLKADNHSAYGKLKVLIDAILGIILFLMLLPLMLLTALVIKLAEPGPVLFTQVRIGQFDRPFVIYKFRTMSIHNGENESLYTLKNDPRITKVGHILRLTHLDELPQLWNVVKGDMSIIGPRAEWNKLVERYKKEIPFYHLRHMVKPGITGWAQVNYSYGGDVNDACKKLQYDLYYIKHCCPQMDASIILKTFFTMLSASGR